MCCSRTVGDREVGYPVDVDDWVFPSRNGKLKQPSSLVNGDP